MLLGKKDKELSKMEMCLQDSIVEDSLRSSLIWFKMIPASVALIGGVIKKVMGRGIYLIMTIM